MPEGVAGSRSCRADIGVAIVPVDPPRMEDALVVNQLVAGPAHMVHDFVLASFLQRFPNSPTQIVQDLVPGNSLPFAPTALSCPTQRIENALWVIHLIDGGRTFGAVSPTAPGMGGIAFKLLDLRLFLGYVSQQSTRRLAVEADRRD